MTDTNFQGTTLYVDYISFEDLNEITATLIPDDQIFSVDPTITNETFEDYGDLSFIESFLTDNDNIEVPNTESFPIYNFDTHAETLELLHNIIAEALHDDDIVIDNEDAEKIVIDNVDANEVMPDGMYPFYCKECDKNYHKSGPYRQHRNAHHGSKSRKRCKICGKHFASAQILNEHLTKHKDESRTFKCQQCPKAYVHKVDLKRHKMIHEPNSKPYQCGFCDKKYIRMSHYKNHYENHMRKKGIKFKLN